MWFNVGIMTRPTVNREDTLNLLYAETGWIKHDYKSSTFINPACLSTIRRQYDDKLSGVYHNPELFYCKPTSYKRSYLYSGVGLWPSLQSWSANIMLNGHKYHIFPYLIIFYNLGYKPWSYIYLGIVTRPVVNRQGALSFLSAGTTWINSYGLWTSYLKHAD